MDILQTIKGPQNLSLDADHIRVIVAVLRKQPYEMVANTLDTMKEQLLAANVPTGGPVAGGATPTLNRIIQPHPPSRLMAEIQAADAARDAAKKEAPADAPATG